RPVVVAAPHRRRPPEQHLPGRSPVHVDDCRPAAGNVAPSEKLRMDLHTVAGADRDWLRVDQQRSGPFRRSGHEWTSDTGFGIDDRRYSRLPRRCREDYDLPDPYRRAALDSRARRQDPRLAPRHLNRPDVAAVEVATVCDVEEPVTRRAESRRSSLAAGWGERSRLAPLGRYRIEPGPVIVLPGEHEEIFRSPLHGPQLHVLRVP